MLGQGIQKAWLNKQIETHARFIESQLAVKPWFAGEQLSMADIQMSFPIFALLSRGGIADLPHTQSWKKRVEMRPAWQRAIEQGGPLISPVRNIDPEMLQSCAGTITFAHRSVNSSSS
jgi:glutathione S-transferase